MGMELVDIGINLTHRSFDHDRDEVIARGVRAGVKTLIITGTTVRDSQRAAELTRQRPGSSFSTAGVHPYHAAECDATTIDTLRALAADPTVVAAGATSPRSCPRS